MKMSMSRGPVHRGMQSKATFANRANLFTSRMPTRKHHVRVHAVDENAGLKALIFDCDGVILESEHLHREAYNEAFKEFGLEVEGEIVNWDEDFYDVLQNTIGGGKNKMRWVFSKYGWPSQKGGIPPASNVDEQEEFIDMIQDFKTKAYKKMIADGIAKPRPGILEVMQEAKESGIALAVCSAATKSAVEFVLTNLLGDEQFESLDCFLAGDDVSKKKPDPEIYITASKRLDSVDPESCLVIEDSTIGLNAALGAGMPCVVTYTKSTESEEFKGAKRIMADMGNVKLADLVECMKADKVVDDRIVAETLNQ